MATDVVAIGVSLIALGVSAVTFYIGHTRDKKSEEIRISREIWERIDANYYIIEKWFRAKSDPKMYSTMVNTIDPLRNEIDY